MIEAKDILSMNYYTYGQAFTGSCTGMRYRIIMLKRETGKDENDKPVYEKYFETAIWPEPYGYEAADPEKITKKEFPFTEGGYNELIAYLNTSVEEYKA
ncbi:MAG: hypothetical protein K6G45_09690 [Lachnospiraceae bacterium]|nr:hypothetical protein [Lachnospiraceae bacterium]